MKNIKEMYISDWIIEIRFLGINATPNHYTFVLRIKTIYKENIRYSKLNLED